MKLLIVAVGLGNVTHQLERGLQKYSLNRAWRIGSVRRCARFPATLIEIMADRRSQQRSQRSADHETESSTK